MSIKITFDPPVYNGWKLEHYPNNEKPFCARKGHDFASAETLSALQGEITRAESELLHFTPPIKAMWKHHSPVAWIPVEFHAMRDGKIFFRDERGEAHSEYINNLSSSHVSDRFRLINDEYHDLAKQVDAAAKANQKAYDKVVALKRRFVKVTPELFESAKVVAGKEIV
jgi:hypothetical protein